MILSAPSIQKLLDAGTLNIEPEAILKDASIKIHLSNHFAKIGEEYTEQSSYTLKPKEFILALTKEKVIFPMTHAGLYDGYTHLSRKGIMTHMGSMYIDPGSDCHITLEIFNASDKEIVIEEGMRVGHVVVLEVK